ncbi:serine protease [Chloroflexota bacterium]
MALTAEQTLRLITVGVSRDGENLHGTGFFIDADHIITCYHVLIETDADPLEDTYHIRHDDWHDWVVAQPVVGQCLPEPLDIAILLSSESCTLSGASGPFGPFPLADWDTRPGGFRAKGYDYVKIAYHLGANTIYGRIQGYIPHHRIRRLHLQTDPGTVLGGRSGSPLWSAWQCAIVGMVSWAGPGLESRGRSLDLAIPLELALPELAGRARCYARVRTPRLRQQLAYQLAGKLSGLETRASRVAIITPQIGGTAAVSVMVREMKCAIELELGAVDDPQLNGLKQRYLKRLHRLSELVMDNLSHGRPQIGGLIPRLRQAHTKLYNRVDIRSDSWPLEHAAFIHWCSALHAADAIWES